ncbi:MAG: hypothetical protein J6Y64_05310 [Ruminococcus sp.]|nr:hypothetical protein [Ruminococcus sp.]
MTKSANKITGAVILAFITLFGALTLFGNKSNVSVTENRQLSELPKITADKLYSGKTTEELGAYITDNFAGRSHWISAKTALQTELSESIVNGVYIGNDRLLDIDASHRAPISVNADIFSRYAANYGGTVYFAVIPTSSGIYGDILPAYINYRSDSQQISAFYDLLEGNKNIRKIDAFNILKMLKDNYIYYCNDTKWTSYGAYYVYKTVIRKLGFQPTSYDKYTIEHVTNNFRGNLYNRTLSKKTKADIIDIYDYPEGADVISCVCTRSDGSTFKGSIYDRSRLDTSDMYSMYLGEAVPFMKITTSANSDKKLLVIKDSYADCFIPFLIQHYKEIMVVSPEDMDGFISDYINVNDYEQTLFLFGIENLGDRKTLEKIIERN